MTGSYSEILERPFFGQNILSEKKDNDQESYNNEDSCRARDNIPTDGNEVKNTISILLF